MTPMAYHNTSNSHRMQFTGKQNTDTDKDGAKRVTNTIILRVIILLHVIVDTMISQHTHVTYNNNTPNLQKVVNFNNNKKL